MSEPLDIKNVIEVNKIRTILREHPDLLSLFEILIIIANNRINDEKTGIDLPIEDNIEPDLSDHESDD
tara:strand:- start:173 stop:376 length:204 start_codon:yes stop_codon:yes gene_type:complete